MLIQVRYHLRSLCVCWTPGLCITPAIPDPLNSAKLTAGCRRCPCISPIGCQGVLVQVPGLALNALAAWGTGLRAWVRMDDPALAVESTIAWSHGGSSSRDEVAGRDHWGQQDRKPRAGKESVCGKQQHLKARLSKVHSSWPR